MTAVPEARARVWTAQVLEAAGMSEADATLVVDQLVGSDLRGVYSHGLLRLPTYARRMREGLIDASARPEVVRSTGATALVDGRHAMGQVAGTFAMREAIRLAREHGTSFVSVRRSNHYGACAHYAAMAAAEGMIGITGTVGAKNIMAPWGGADPLLGNNPFGVAIPAGRHPAVVLDMAMSVAAGGKIQLAAKEGRQIPDDWALGPDGRPTTDARLAWQRLMVRPLGGHKGYAMALVIALLAAVLPDAAIGDAVGDLHGDFQTKQDVGHFMQVVDVGRFDEPGAFRARVDEMIDLMHGARLAADASEVLVPGELEERNVARQRASGIEYPEVVLGELDGLGTQLGVGPLTRH